MLQESEPPELLTVREALELFAGYFERRRSIDETIAQVGLGAAGRPARRASSRAASGAGSTSPWRWSASPELLFLDEPTTGFDPAARREAWEVIDALRELGKTILLTTHYLEEAQRLADRVAIVKDGVIVAEGPPDEIGGEERAIARIRFVAPEAELPGGLVAAPVRDGRVELRTTAPVAGPRACCPAGRASAGSTCRASRSCGRASRTSTWS